MQHGIPKTDPFSYTMPSYPYIEHAWLADIVIAGLFPYIGMLGLAILFSILALAALGVHLVPTPKKWLLLAFTLAALTFLPFFGIRSQIMGWLLFSVTLKVISFAPDSRWRYFLPLILLLWVNVHGSFAIGIAVILLDLVYTFIKKHGSLRQVFIFLLSILVTFINPYGMQIWREVWMTVAGNSNDLRWFISEWYPAVFFAFPAMWFFIGISLSLIILYRKRFTLFE